MKDRLQAIWPHLRAVLIIVHVVAILLFALPNPGSALNRRAWKTPAVQLEMKRWSERLTSMGRPTTPPQLEDELYAVAKRWYDLRAGLLEPFSPYHRYLGIRQPWTMFAAPHRFPARLEVHIEVDGKWKPVYIARSDEHDWQRTLMDHDRMRAATFRYIWPQYNGDYRHLANWLAKAAARDFPEAKRARIRWLRRRSPSPKQVREDDQPRGSYERPVTVDLGPLREAK